MTKNEKIKSVVVIIILVIIVLAIEFIKLEKPVDKKENTIENIRQIEDVDNKQIPQNYSMEEAIQDGCVVITYEKIYNKGKLDKFIENTSVNSKNRIEDSVRIIQYTIEGDMIITDLEYKITDETYVLSGETVNKTKYIMSVDNTRDKFASEEDRKIIVNENIPGEIYGIMEREEGEYVYVEIALCAEINYVDETVKPYEDIYVCAYRKNAEIVPFKEIEQKVN